jgi:hypothetical protein
VRKNGSRRRAEKERWDDAGRNFARGITTRVQKVVLKVADLPGFIAELKKAGLHFRNEMETGPGGRQIQLEDPDGNPLERFEPAR